MYPEWFKAVREVHAFDRLQFQAETYDWKVCPRYNPHSSKDQCKEFHSEVATILILCGGWTCHLADKYASHIVNLAVRNGGMPDNPKSMLWPWNRCPLFRHPGESDPDYYDRLLVVIRSKAYAPIFGKFAKRQKLLEKMTEDRDTVRVNKDVFEAAAAVLISHKKGSNAATLPPRPLLNAPNQAQEHLK